MCRRETHVKYCVCSFNMLSSSMQLKIAWSWSRDVLVATCPGMVASSKLSKRPAAHGGTGVKLEGYHAHKRYFSKFEEIRCVKVFSPTEKDVAYLYYEFTHKGVELRFSKPTNAEIQFRKKIGRAPTELESATPDDYARTRLEILMPALKHYMPGRASNFIRLFFVARVRFTESNHSALHCILFMEFVCFPLDTSASPHPSHHGC